MGIKRDKIIRESGRAKRHQVYRTSSGEIVPGGSTLARVISFQGNDGLLSWAVGLEREGIDYELYRQEAASFGSVFHAIVESRGLGKPFRPELHVGCYIEPATQMADSFIKNLDRLGLVMLDNEVLHVSDEDRVGGAIDIVAGLKGALAPSILIDLKGSNSIGVSEMIQVCGVYSKLFASKFGRPPEDIYIARCDRNPPHACTMYKPDQEQVQASLFLAGLARQAWDVKKTMTRSIPVV